MKFIKKLEELGKGDAAIAGGKGASLGEMTQAKIPVPPGYVVLTNAFDRFLEESDLTQEIRSELNNVDKDKMHTVEYASERIQSMILKAKMPQDISKEVEKEFRGLGAQFVAVRSSATAEDSGSASWAGELDSYLNTTKETLLTNVQKCWASLFTARAIFYRFEKSLKDSHVSVAVVVQKMVNSDISGIAFSVHPVTQDPNQLIIEAGWGLGEAIVSGSITPDSYVVSKKDNAIIDINISEQKKEIVRKKGGGNEWKNVLESKRDNQKLDGKQIITLSEMVVRIEKHYKFPCDIEWAMEKGEMYIVQSRPITTL